MTMRVLVLFQDSVKEQTPKPGTEDAPALEVQLSFRAANLLDEFHLSLPDRKGPRPKLQILGRWCPAKARPNQAWP